MKKDINYKSHDNITTINACIWEPITEVKAIVQISHGMVEHIGRYEKLAEELNKVGILVCGNDHLGHGKSVIDKDHYGYFAAKKSSKILVDDVHSLTELVKKDYPNVPYFVLGHSMGSFIIRNYIQEYSNEVDGAIIVGSAFHSQCFMGFSKFVTVIDKFYHGGWFYRSRYLKKTTTNTFTKKFEEGKTNPNCWLTKDENVLRDYANDPYTHFTFTSNAYYTMFSLIKECCKFSKIKKIRKDLPILIMSGKDDPVGDFGEGVLKLENAYKKAKIKDVKVKLYNGVRHEVLNERERVIAINDIIQFVNMNILKSSK